MSIPARSYWNEDDLGRPLPDMPHAVSVCMPRWQDVVDYEEGRERVISALASGYPRFVYHALYKKLCAHFTGRYADPHHFAFPLPSESAARKCVTFVGAGGSVVRTDDGVAVALLPRGREAQAKIFWQHTGHIITSRQAENILTGKAPSAEGAQAQKTIRADIAALYGIPAEDIYLFSCGMSAIFTAYEAATAADKTRKTAQLGFPYLDTLKILQKFGAGGVYVPYNSPNDIDKLAVLLETEKIGAVFCEIPGNPLLRTIDLPRLRALLDHHHVPLVIDDTLGSALNVELRPYADIIVSSLTKFYSGVGNVMGGALLLNPARPYYKILKAQAFEESLYADDAVILAQNSRDFRARMPVINRSAEKLAAWLAAHEAVESVFHPSLTDRAAYDRVRKEGGGYGGLLSFILKDKSRAAGVYDRLEVHKGPSLGTNYTLACPYTILAHYTEFDFAESNGVDRTLIRVSVGLEDSDDLIARFNRALK